MQVEKYKAFRDILDLAYLRCSEGKGSQRHGGDAPFDEQDLIKELRYFGINPGLGQIRKKAKEVTKLKGSQAKINELLDVIVYAAGCIRKIQLDGKA